MLTLRDKWQALEQPRSALCIVWLFQRLTVTKSEHDSAHEFDELAEWRHRARKAHLTTAA